MPVEVNKFQTAISEELLSNLSAEYKSEFYEILETIPLVRELIRKDRKYARDLKRDDKNRIVVDIEHPHILEDTDYFRQSALNFQKNSKYTSLFPNTAYGSEYRKFWDEEINRCINGYVRDSDGEWVTGYHYFYLNYCRIDLVEKDEYDKDIKVEKAPTFWDGDYWWFHYLEQCEVNNGHAVCLKSRRKGYSYKSSAMACRNYHMIEKSKSYFVADNDEYLIKDGIMTKAWQNTAFINEYTEFKKSSDKINRPKHKRASYEDPADRLEKGFMSEMIGMTVGDDPDKPAGKAGKLMLFEESGKNRNLLYCQGRARPSFEQGRRVFGQMVFFGTGGTENADFSGLWELFCNSSPYNIYAIRDIYNKAQDNSYCGYFHPEYINREYCYDADGNSDVTHALIEILEDRQKIKHVSDANMIVARKAELPITPVEAVMKREGNFFPVTDIREYLAPIIADEKKFCSSHHVVDLALDSTGHIIPMPITRSPIREYPIPRDVNKQGAIEIFEMPDTKLKFNYWRYIAGIDPYDDDEAKFSDSLGSMCIFDRFKRKFVFDFTGRPKFANDFYEICLRGLMYYNALANYENNRKGLFAYFEQKHALRFLCDTPRVLRDMDMVKDRGNYGNKSKGYNANAQINAWGRRLQLDWMLSPAYEEDGENKGRINLHTERSVGYLKEVLAWNSEGNFDRCLVSGSMVLCTDGYKPIEEINVGDGVITKSGNINNVYLTHKNNYSGGVTKITTFGNTEELICTDNHPILIRRYIKKPHGKNWFKLKNQLPLPQYINAENIAVGDFVYVPKRKNLSEPLFNNDILYIIGWYISDGWCCGRTNQIKFYFGDKEYDLAISLRDKINKYFGSGNTEFNSSNQYGNYGKRYFNWGSYAKVIKSKDSNMWIIIIHSRKLKDILTQHGGFANNKKLSQELFNSGGLMPLIVGYLEGDGHFRNNIRADGCKRFDIEANCVDRVLIYQIRQILIDNGIFPSLRTLPEKDKNMPNDIHGNYSIYHCRKQYSIQISGKYCNKIIKLSDKYRGELCNGTNLRYKHIETDDGFWVMINGVVRENYSGYVHNISVDNDNTYVVNNITTHNCDARGACLILDADMNKFELVKSEDDNPDPRIKSLKEFQSNFFRQ